MKKRLLTGLQPSGELTIGNYIGSIRQVANYQDEYETFLFVPDMHSITVPQDPETLHRRVREIVGMYIACGVSPTENHIYIQSEIPWHANLSWILECHSYMGEMSRMTQFKAKSEGKKEIGCGLFTYPILMAADILLYNADVVPTGADQKQHVELARNLAQRFNKKYGETFVVPEPLIPKFGAKIRDLLDPTKKMSKSAENPKASIFLNDPEKAIRKKIMGAVTDSGEGVVFDEENKPGVSNLLTIYSCFSNMPIADAEKHFEGARYGDLKKEVAEVVVEALTQLQDKYAEVMKSGIVDETLDRGRDEANAIAHETYEKARKVVGLGRV
ncbi:MAG: tryptophan--tRNA ligase [Thermoguttaceae bacterium]|nr:tryptophan--tRNA ligase [Thermoguttaceae bacterium]